MRGSRLESRVDPNNGNCNFDGAGREGGVPESLWSLSETSWGTASWILPIPALFLSFVFLFFFLTSTFFHFLFSWTFTLFSCIHSSFLDSHTFETAQQFLQLPKL